jgi:hypothetical protein
MDGTRIVPIVHSPLLSTAQNSISLQKSLKQLYTPMHNTCSEDWLGKVRGEKLMVFMS